MNNYTPQEIVTELDKYIIGQHDAKKAVAIALRNRYRRQLLPLDLQEDIVPKNIIMMGPTGVGKTEIARRMAKLVQAPFIKVEATKFTEVGYVGRDAESIIRELLETAIRMEKARRLANVKDEAEKLANERIIDILTSPTDKPKQTNPFGMLFNTQVTGVQTTPAVDESLLARRNSLRQQLQNKELEQMVIDVEVADKSASIQLFGNSGLEEMGINLGDMFGNLLPTKKKKRRVTIAEARRLFAQEEAENLLDMDQIVKQAIQQTEQRGIVFLDEIDKIAVKSAGQGGPDVSREGVQRDILPIVEGTTVVTKHGPVKTDYILFIAAGAFHVATPADLIPELQGRFPIRVELESLSQRDLERILTEPKNSLVKQYTALLGTEKIIINFTKEAISELAAIACHVNMTNENIGARRLHTIMEKLLEDLSFKAPDLAEQEITIDTTYVRERLSNIAGNEDMSRYIL